MIDGAETRNSSPLSTHSTHSILTLQKVDSVNQSFESRVVAVIHSQEVHSRVGSRRRTPKCRASV